MNENTFETQQVETSRDVLAFYDAYASSWDSRFGDARSTSEFHRLRLRTFLELARLRATDRVAEIGVGTGPYVGSIAPSVAELTCIDGSEQMLKVLRGKYASVPNLLIRRADLEKPNEDLPTGLDLVYGFGILEHILDHRQFLANCRGMLKPGGRLLFVTPNGRCPWYGPARRLWRAGAHCSSDHYFTKDEMDAVLGDAGFLPDREILWGYFPAGVGNGVLKILTLAGSFLDRTPLRKFAGGITASYTAPE